MDTVEVICSSEPVNEKSVIDGAALIRRLTTVRSSDPRDTACMDNPPLTLYGAYRQGVEDYAARRANPYRAGSRFWALWEEGRIEAETDAR
ncbi:hypothetical protein WM09_17840 [Burkholderia ubonensis]|uniref:hypothetical protein n=1 Tax=Burkholderia ubonensis TaxID=101571 RepID=UPI000758F0A5|nr:hypothetical protein [Burkholderia ubonensis]KWI86400.1 hypothetical protein WM09_17840 [Burkholderia ubonensis]